LIPELVGRLPVLVSIDPLDEEALLRILVEPKNALIKQYQLLLSLDNVQLEFEQEALQVAVELTMTRETGARGLRSIIESCLLDVMFEIPGRSDISRIVITEGVVKGTGKPSIYNDNDTELKWSADGELEPAA